jgi:DNA mismatch repair protein MutS
MAHEEDSIYDKYFEYTRTHKEKYGKQTVVLMMVGSFFEIYGLKSANGDVSGSEIVEVARICQMNISEKKKVIIDGKMALMAGFPEYTLEKYLQLLCDNNYTSVVVVQDEENSVKGKKKKHVVHSIHSSGTYIPYEVEQPRLSNNIMCVWMTAYTSILKPKPSIVYGISVVNIFTGKSYIMEHRLPFENNPTTFDELERSISIYAPCEIIILYDLEKTGVAEKSLIKSIKSYSGIDCESVHEHCVRGFPRAENCMKQQYLTEILTVFFGSETYEVCEEFSMFQTATQSFCYLLNFIQEHNPMLVKKISTPVFANSQTNAILANHALKQLNIIEDRSADSVRSGRLSSVSKLLNRASTSMGKRRMHEIITNPIFDETALEKEYNMIDYMMTPENYAAIGFFRKMLGNVVDLEKILRQIVIHKVSPSAVYQLYKSLDTVQQIGVCLAENHVLNEYLESRDVEAACSSVLETIRKYICLDACKNINSMVTSTSEHIIQTGIDAELDALMRDLKEAQTNQETIQSFFNLIMRNSANSGDDTDYVRINTTEKSGSSFQITKVRAKVLKSQLDAGTYKSAPCFRGCLTVVSNSIVVFKNYKIVFTDLKFKDASASNNEIAFEQLNRVCMDILNLEHAISRKISEIYESFVEDVLEKTCYNDINRVVDYVIRLDVLQNKVYVAKEYRYCRPKIIDSATHSCCRATGVRHCLIEHLQQNERYVTNDVELDGGGFLLYGTNAVGKTSLIRAIGIVAIMAQCGMFVPCTTFEYKPYRSFFTRILGNDNLYKGLSTFAVEMSELRVILKNADKNSLILGDELCSGTETQSALSIFVAGLMDLREKAASFIFATHFHEIVNYEEIAWLPLKHMSVFYDRETDCLVYDRLLKDGAGNDMYGLEVCKSLHLPTDFLDKAFAIRNKYFPEKKGILDQVQTRYNSQKIRGVCEMCNLAPSTETHHLEMQSNADREGFIDGTAFHKNHKANLMALCEACHQNVHHGDDISVLTVDSESAKAASSSKGASKGASSNASNASNASKKKVVRKKTTKGYSVFVEDSE